MCLQSGGQRSMLGCWLSFLIAVFFFFNTVIRIKFKAFLPLSCSPRLFTLGDRLSYWIWNSARAVDPRIPQSYLPIAGNTGMCHHTAAGDADLGSYTCAAWRHRPSSVDYPLFWVLVHFMTVRKCAHSLLSCSKNSQPSFSKLWDFQEDA